jgi:uncharacterized phage protein (TIGR02218 family)
MSMASFLEPDLTTIALCWRIERRDGAAIGFTTHDRDLPIGGLAYRAAPGMLPSAITLSDGFDAGTLDIAGALTSAAISAADLAAGRWDGASVTIFMVDWERPDGAPLRLARGELGDVAASGERFEAELRGPTALLDRPVVEQTSPECRAELGDKRCRVDMAGRVRMTRVVAVPDEESVEVADASPAANAHGYGRLRWISGANSGLESPIAASAGARLTLREPPHFAPAAGDLVELHEGCDRRFATCRARFANAANFRGEPHLPGMDLLTRYPGA